MEVPHEGNPYCSEDWEKWFALCDRLDQICDRNAATAYEQAHNVLKLSPADRDLYLEFMENPQRFEEIDGRSFPIPRWLHFLKQEFVGAPVLVLACKGEPRFQADKDWHRIELQTAGYACRHSQFYALHLPVKAGIFEKMVMLEKEFFGSQLYVGSSPLQGIIDYRNALKSIFSCRLDCDRSYGWLEEAAYPIDFSKEAIEELIEADDDFIREYEARKWCYPLCHLLVLTANSD